ncbi:DUF1580 domain-containing protein [Rhodopirellula sp. JC639]|uniref:DUF1580 domain-containing protein n=1 Tax=Stieleria mannarensis TaxID=2755585 RepID=UPI001601AF6C|nr:DUF1580 domain-containing protein [Rhodopirellula sp. JC639]
MSKTEASSPMETPGVNVRILEDPREATMNKSNEFKDNESNDRNDPKFPVAPETSVLQETTISIRDACRTGGRKRHRSTLYRWMTRGVRGIRLESALFGGERVTSIEALSRFFERLNGSDESNVNLPKRISQNGLDSSRADAELAAEGM